VTIAPASPPDVSPARVGLALGSGSARGLAHIGVIRALEEAGVRIDCVAGTSMGALIGAIHASGKLKDLEATFLGFDWKKTLSFFDFVLPKSGMLDGARISELVRAHVHAEVIEHLPTPFSAVATDILTGDEVTLDSGDVIEAVRASISVPGIFTPVRSNGRVLVDGGLCNPVPVSAAREMGASFIIGVDLNHEIIAGKNLKPLLQPGVESVSAAGGAQNGMLARWGASYRQSMLDLKQKLLDPGTPGSTQWSRWLSREESLPSVFEVLLASINIMETGITRSRLAADRPDLIIRPPLGHIRFLEFARAAEIITIGYEHTRNQLAALPPATLAAVRDRAA
jgi:NTE family protein